MEHGQEHRPVPFHVSLWLSLGFMPALFPLASCCSATAWWLPVCTRGALLAKALFLQCWTWSWSALLLGL